MEADDAPPLVLVMSGLDPTGGAGIQADIEAIGAQGGHALPLITASTVQDTRRVHEVVPVAPALLLRQGRRLLEGLQPAAIKIGLLPSQEVADAVLALVEACSGVPLVLDPVLRSGGGQPLAPDMPFAKLLPRCTLITPNRHEARALTGATTPARCAARLRQAGVEAVLITGADEAEGRTLTNSLYQASGEHHWQWPKLPASYHGSGCTLAAATAARLALGDDLVSAVERAQRYTHRTLEEGWRPAPGQYLPRRLSHG